MRSGAVLSESVVLATEGVDRSPQSGHGTWWALVDRMALGVRTPGLTPPPSLFGGFFGPGN